MVQDFDSSTAAPFENNINSAPLALEAGLFQSGQLLESSRQLREDTQREVQAGSLPDLQLVNSPGNLPEARRIERSQERQPADRIDYNASDRFKEQLRSTTESVRQQMPPLVRDILSNVQVQPVKSITDVQTGQQAGGMYAVERDPNRILMSERGSRGAVEAVLKHEFGHPFDYLSSKPMLSENPQFRKLVNDAVRRDPGLRAERHRNPDGFYAEVFADMFARNLGAPSRDLTMQNGDRRMPEVRNWVRARMYGHTDSTDRISGQN